MTDPGSLFSLIRIEPDSLVLNPERFAAPRSRFFALVRSIEQFGILVVGENDEDLAEQRLPGRLGTHNQAAWRWLERLRSVRDAPSKSEAGIKSSMDRWTLALDEIEERVQSGAIRFLKVTPDEVERATTVRLPNWEDSPLGDPWHALVVPEGHPVVELLDPAFRAHDHVVVLDPALGGPSERACCARNRLVELCRGRRVRRLEVFTEYGLPHVLKKAKHADWPDRLPVELAGHGEKSSLLMTWWVKKNDGRFHDRFIGFTRRGTRNDCFQAVFLGCGVLSFVTEGIKPRPTTVARIPGSAFKSALDHVKKMEEDGAFKTVFESEVVAVGASATR